MAGEIERWITVNGAHIPIIKGESRARAVSTFIKGKQKARKSEIRNKLKGMFKDPNGKSELQKEVLKNSTNAIAKNKRPTIKGRAKTKNEKALEASKKIMEDYRNRVAERLAKADEYKKKADKFYSTNNKEKGDRYMEKRDKLYEKNWLDKVDTHGKQRDAYLKVKGEKDKRYKLKTEKPTIRGRAKTRDEIEDERFDKYDEYAHNAARNIRFDNRAKPLSQDELYDRAHAVAQASSMYDMDYKYGRGGTHENKQVRIGDNIESSRYKLKTEPKRTIRGAITDKERRANKAALPYKEKREKYEAQGDKYYEKAQSEPRNTTGSDNRFHSAMSKMSIAYEKAHKADTRAGETWLKAYYSKKKYTYKRKK